MYTTIYQAEIFINLIFCADCIELIVFSILNTL